MGTEVFGNLHFAKGVKVAKETRNRWHGTDGNLCQEKGKENDL